MQIDAWARLTGRAPTAWEVGVLRRMDGATLLAVASKKKGGAPSGAVADASDPEQVRAAMRSLMSARPGA